MLIAGDNILSINIYYPCTKYVLKYQAAFLKLCLKTMHKKTKLMYEVQIESLNTTKTLQCLF